MNTTANKVMPARGTIPLRDLVFAASIIILAGALWFLTNIVGPLETSWATPQTLQMIGSAIVLSLCLLGFGLFTAWLHRAANRNQDNRLLGFLEKLRRVAAWEPLDDAPHRT